MLSPQYDGTTIILVWVGHEDNWKFIPLLQSIALMDEGEIRQSCYYVIFYVIPKNISNYISGYIHVYIHSINDKYVVVEKWNKCQSEKVYYSTN